MDFEGPIAYNVIADLEEIVAFVASDNPKAALRLEKSF